MRQISTPLPLIAIHTGNPWKSIYGATLSPWIDAGDSNTILIKKTLKQREQGDRLIKDLHISCGRCMKREFFMEIAK